MNEGGSRPADIPSGGPRWLCGCWHTPMGIYIPLATPNKSSILATLTLSHRMCSWWNLLWNLSSATQLAGISKYRAIRGACLLLLLAMLSMTHCCENGVAPRVPHWCLRPTLIDCRMETCWIISFIPYPCQVRFMGLDTGVILGKFEGCLWRRSQRPPC